MRYKAQYSPSELLDLPTLTWRDTSDCLDLLEKDPHVVSLYADKPLGPADTGLPPYDPANRKQTPSMGDVFNTPVKFKGKIYSLDVNEKNAFF